MIYITNSFSIQMLGPSLLCGGIFTVDIIPTSADKVREEINAPGAEFQNVIGHKSLSDLAQKEIGFYLGENQRKSIKMNSGDRAFIFQYSGPRLPEGATELPEGATVEWFKVRQTNLV